MQLEITSKGHSLSDHLRSHIAEKMGKLEKYIHGESQAHVVLERNHNGQIVEISLHANRHTMHTREMSDNVMACIDKAIAKVESQLRKIKEKMTDKKGAGQ